MARTDFNAIYEDFFTRVTDDMYEDVLMTKEDTEKDLQNILIAALPKFEFPRFDVFDYNLGTYDVATGVWTDGYFNSDLTREEINILSLCMIEEWLRRIYSNTELLRQKYTGADFKVASQANHIARLIALKKEAHEDNFHLQRLYKRRKVGEDGRILSTMGQIMTTPDYGYVREVSNYDE